MIKEFINYISFDLEVGREAPAENVSNSVISGSRVGKPGNEGVVEDNGVALTNISDKPLEAWYAHQYLSDVSAAVRQTPSNGNPQAGATTASAFLTMDEVAVRGAGDSIVAVISEYGKVHILNEFHVAGGEVITNSVERGKASFEDLQKDYLRTYEWQEIQAAMGTEKLRIVTMSDGVSASHDPRDIEKDIQHLIKTGDLSIDDEHFAEKLASQARSSNNRNPKSDDLIILSAMRPQTPQQQSALTVFDGIGSGGRDSAVIANDLSQASIKILEQRTGRDSTHLNNIVDLSVDGVVLDELSLQQQLIEQIQKEQVETLDTVKEGVRSEGIIFRNNNPIQLAALQKTLEKHGIKSVIEGPASGFGEGLRVKTESLDLARQSLDSAQSSILLSQKLGVDVNAIDAIKNVQQRAGENFPEDPSIKEQEKPENLDPNRRINRSNANEDKGIKF